MTSERKQVLSGIQPTGDMHFGNYFGAVQNWVRLQDTYECLYCVVDYHAITMPYQPKKLRTNTWELIFNLLSTGILPENLFIQSMIPEHAELGWIFNCFTSYGQLTRMTQFKDKSSDSKNKSGDGFISAGLFDYPVLQAADILIYRADYVPVGKDQEQHLELTRNIADRFNAQVGKEYFVLPESLYTEVPKVMSTADPTRKMSKSAGEKHYINVFGDAARIGKQVRSAVTDPGPQTQEVDAATGLRNMSPGVENLFSLLKAAGRNEAHQELLSQYHAGSLSYGSLKGEVAEALLAISAQLIERKKELNANKKDVKNQIKASSARIREQAKATLRDVKELTGLMQAK
ncbi:MAG: tryptophan--tRNA ligase [Bacteroidota bacterium]